MEQEEPRKSAPEGKSSEANPFDAEGAESERSSGEYCFVYHEVARITTVRKSIPARSAEANNVKDAKRDKSR